MNIVFVSNYLNHHQLYLCREFLKKSDSFYFISTDKEHLQGFQKIIEEPYVLFFDEQKERCLDLIQKTDLCIFGSCPNELIDLRMRSNLLSFIYTERFFKKGLWRRFLPTTRKKVFDRVLKYKNNNLFVLCAGAYVSLELKKLGFPIEKCFKWGYFPETKEYTDINQLFSQKTANSILWCGRFLDWKHPEYVIRLAKALIESKRSFTIKMIGSGPLKELIKEKIAKENLGSFVTIVDPLTPSEIRKQMEEASIFLLTSDEFEGWGAVINESMNSGCVVVASDKAGATNYLIKDKCNGIIFKNKNTNDLINKVFYMLNNVEEQKRIGKNAILTICDVWNSNVASTRLIDISNHILLGKGTNVFNEGPCSLAELITEKKIKK